MYHTHINDYGQLSTGLYGPLVVVEPGHLFDPETEKIFVFGRGPDEDNDPVLINGSSTPAPLHLRTGIHYRFRLIQITPGNCVQLYLGASGAYAPATWRAIAKDGAMLSRELSTTTSANLKVFPGETYDFEFYPRKSGVWHFVASVHNGKIRTELQVIVR